jgi:hypothetical protein
MDQYMLRNALGVHVYTKLLKPGSALLLQDWAAADRLLRDSLTVFQHALNMAPEDTRALGNCGNVLLAQVNTLSLPLLMFALFTLHRVRIRVGI